jgi:hypothetical protein
VKSKKLLGHTRLFGDPGARQVQPHFQCPIPTTTKQRALGWFCNSGFLSINCPRSVHIIVSNPCSLPRLWNHSRCDQRQSHPRRKPSTPPSVVGIRLTWNPPASPLLTPSSPFSRAPRLISKTSHLFLVWQATWISYSRLPFPPDTT